VFLFKPIRAVATKPDAAITATIVQTGLVPVLNESASNVPVNPPKAAMWLLIFHQSERSSKTTITKTAAIRKILRTG